MALERWFSILDHPRSVIGQCFKIVCLRLFFFLITGWFIKTSGISVDFDGLKLMNIWRSLKGTALSLFAKYWSMQPHNFSLFVCVFAI